MSRRVRRNRGGKRRRLRKTKGMRMFRSSNVPGWQRASLESLSWTNLRGY